MARIRNRHPAGSPGDWFVDRWRGSGTTRRRCSVPTRIWSRETPETCWYSWGAKTGSLARFADGAVPVDRLFCGHGCNVDLPAAVFGAQLGDLVERMPTL